MYKVYGMKLNISIEEIIRNTLTFLRTMKIVKIVKILLNIYLKIMKAVYNNEELKAT